ncbi:4Fe-4S dicluster domain-containing protein [Garciella nitratireducens]|uniref:2-oxoglutarate ferredoxin oxidoreductase subunit delta n=1 Tax=Garciella nitratireducens DSM 15102 TaxID=1121911 RepID=A0A1T4JV06_9FIRM|nr:4Fe-4S binding protein [Garciella nitratireducens]RBP45590.1 2-oxoglutarate ferredoxin oxidoreductase subunit delta [Garciella nitratireducens]SJZ33978.1 2-oxoglutarate ferredoxin oxidoreductase subunit delta [Garciella nitratireducens DSM 15102]
MSKKIIINKKWCKGCGICVDFCPTKSLKLEDEKVEFVNAQACIQCGLCELRCPDFAIYLGGNQNEE